MVRSIRLEKAWSQEQLAECSGLSVRTIQRIENGAKPGLESIKAIAAALSVEISALQLESNEMTNETTIDSVQESVSNNDRNETNGRHTKAGLKKTAIHFAVILAFLAVINLALTPNVYWIIWPALGMGIAFTLKLIRSWQAETHENK